MKHNQPVLFLSRLAFLESRKILKLSDYSILNLYNVFFKSVEVQAHKIIVIYWSSVLILQNK
jgi:hypothetical protein